jgi:hypothetical protein
MSERKIKAQRETDLILENLNKQHRKLLVLYSEDGEHRLNKTINSLIKTIEELNKYKKKDVYIN